MSWRTAFTNLAAITVTGVTTSYDLDALPGALPAADLPALAVEFGAEGGRFSPDEGLATLTYDGSAWEAALCVDHVLYWTPVGSGGGLLDVLPDLLDAVDAYLSALSADGTLDGALSQPLTVERVQVGAFERAGVAYYGARFRHLWRRSVS